MMDDGDQMIRNLIRIWTRSRRGLGTWDRSWELGGLKQFYLMGHLGQKTSIPEINETF